MAEKVITVAVSKLFLDNENPRHDPIDNEPEIVAQLMRRERVYPLAKHVAEFGLSPFDRVGVIPHPQVDGSFIVVEGNRRVCALKLLRDPEKAPTVKLRKQFAVLKANAEVPLPRTLDAVLLTPERADQWKAVRHLGEQEGVGLRKWNAEGKARHDAKVGSKVNPNAQALALLDFAEKAHLVTPDQREQISLTTVTRYLSNPVLRNALGLATNKDITIQAPQEEFERAAKQFLHDALPPADGTAAAVHSRTKSKDREAYAATLRTRGQAAKTRLPAAVTPVSTRKGPKPTRNNRSPDQRTYVIPAEFKAHLSDRVIKRVFDELRTIIPDDLPFSAGYLLRAFVEMVAHQYATDHGLGIAGELHQVIGRCVTHLAANGAKDRDLKELKVMSSDRHSRTSPDSLGNWVHGGAIPTGPEVKRRWDTLESGLRLLVDGLKK